MKTLLILSLAALAGCSSYRGMLEPGTDKRADVSPEKKAATPHCCGMANCSCGNCSPSGPCECRTRDSHPEPPSGITP